MGGQWMKTKDYEIILKPQSQEGDLSFQDAFCVMTSHFARTFGDKAEQIMLALKQNTRLKKVTKKDLLKWVLTYYEKGEKCKLIVKKDRYNGKYSGAKYLAFKKQPSFVETLKFNGTPEESEAFWKEDARYYDIGKGETPKEAVKNLKKLYKQEKQIARREFVFDKMDDVVNRFTKKS